MKIFNFSEYSSLYNKFLSELRDAQIQKDSMRFRKNLERIGEISAYEISKEFGSSFIIYLYTFREFLKQMFLKKIWF